MVLVVEAMPGGLRHRNVFRARLICAPYMWPECPRSLFCTFDNTFDLPQLSPSHDPESLLLVLMIPLIRLAGNRDHPTRAFCKGYHVAEKGRFTCSRGQRSQWAGRHWATYPLNPTHLGMVPYFI
jgi:hypothetical protein